MQVLLIVCAALACVSCASASSASRCPRAFPRTVWADEFDSKDSLRRNWTPQIGNGSSYGIVGWGNDEFETYTGSQANVRVKNGELLITARTASPTEQQRLCGSPTGCPFTSARLRTYQKFSVAPKPGETLHVSIRAKLPQGTGLWPAMWMLAEDSPSDCSGCGAYGPWPSSGTITIAEAANAMTAADGGIIYGSPTDVRVQFYKERLAPTSDGYHVFALEWSRERMAFFVDGVVAQENSAVDEVYKWFTGNMLTSPPGAPFDKPFHFFNLAVGGRLPGKPSAETVAATLAKPQTMRVDYVRVCSNGKGN